MLEKKNLETVFALGVILALFFYIVVRAILIPITYDEAATFFHYIHLGQFWPGNAHWDANNHILNSCLSWLSYKAFGGSEFALRLPNVVLGAIYLIVAFKISFLVQQKTLRWILFLSLVGCHFTIEFFSVTRGYGMSMAFLISALYFGYRWMKSGSTGLLFLGVLALQLATLANLSLLLSNLLAVGWFAIWLLGFQRRTWVAASSILLLGLICIWWFADLSFEYKSRGLLYYGPGDSFWDVTILSLAEFAFPAVQSIFPVAAVVIAITILACFAYLILKLQKSNADSFQSLFFGYLFAGNLVANILLHLVFDVNYPADRVAIQFLLFAPLAVVYGLESISQQINTTATPKFIWIAAIPLLIYPVNMVLSANLSHITLWKVDASAKKFYEIIAAADKDTDMLLTSTGYRLRSLPFNYYNFRNNGATSPIQWSAYHGNEADFQMCVLEEDGLWQFYDTIAYHPVSGLHLLKRHALPERKLLFSRHTNPIETSSEPYFVWYEADNDTLVGRDLVWDIRVEMPEINAPFEGWISVDVGDPVGNSLGSGTIVLDWLKTSWEKGEILHQQILIPNVAPEATHVKLFFWNIHQQPISFGNVDITVYQLVDDAKNSSTLP